MFFGSAFKQFCTHHTNDFLMGWKSSSLSVCHWANHTEASAMPSTVIRLFSRTIVSTAWILSPVLDADGLPDLSSSHTEVLPFFEVIHS
jgi:hypothetical protein